MSLAEYISCSGCVQRKRIKAPIWDFPLPDTRLLDRLHERLHFPAGSFIGEHHAPEEREAPALRAPGLRRSESAR